MKTIVEPAGLYAFVMAKRELHPAQGVRDGFSARLDETLKGIHTVVTRHGRPIAVLVDMDWYRRASAALEEPTDL